MSWKGSLIGRPFISKFLVFGGVCLLSMTLFTLLGLILASYLFDLDLIFNKELLNHYEDVNVINALKLIQGTDHPSNTYERWLFGIGFLLFFSDLSNL